MLTKSRVWLVVLVVALLVVVAASRGQAGHAWLPILVLLVGIGWLLLREILDGLDAMRREARRK